MTTDRRRLEVIAVPWGETSRRTEQGYRERMLRGAITPEEITGLPVIDGHTGTAVGVVESARDTAAGLVSVIRLSPIGRADDLYSLAADGALGASVGFDPGGHRATVDAAGIVTRSRVQARELSLTPLPAYAGARVLQVRNGVPAMAEDAAPEETPAGSGESATYEFTAPEAVTVTTAATPETRSAPIVHRVPASAFASAFASVEAVERLSARIDAVRSATPGDPASPLARFPSFGHYAAAAYRGEVTPEETRALADQITTNNPGVMPPSWVNDVKGIVSRPRRLIDGTGGPMSPGDSGMDLAFPYFDGTLSALVAPQATQKTQVTSVRVDLKKGTAALVTYAGGSDIAYQLLERSSPSYLDAYLRIMASAYGVVTEAAFAAAVLAAAGTPGAAAGLPAFYEWVIGASATIEDATGSGASVIGVASDVWPKLAGATDADGRPIFPPVNPQNAPGVPTGPGAVGGISVAGIPVYRSPGLTAGKVVALNGEAARWAEDGPRTISAEDVPLLGRDVAVYGYAAPALFVPGGCVAATVTFPEALAAPTK